MTDSKTATSTDTFCWRIKCWLARRGCFRTEGAFATYRGPRGVVIYPDGARSVAMPLGNAFDYAGLHAGSKVRPPNLTT